MPNYRRAFQPGGTFFFTLVTENRAPLFSEPHARQLLHNALAECRSSRPFTLDAIVLLPDHLHLLITLPDNDPDFSTRLAFIKSHFTRNHLASGGPEQPRSESRVHQQHRGVWQRRFWEHTIRDQPDLNAHFDYIHYNPVKHALAPCPHSWPHSSFHRHVQSNNYEPTWCCSCHNATPTIPDFSSIPPNAE